MKRLTGMLGRALFALTLISCTERAITTPRATAVTRDVSVGDRHTVVVNPDAKGAAVAHTISEALDMVENGGTILVRPGIYAERFAIPKGVTIRGIALDEGEAVIYHSQPTNAPATDGVIRIETSEPVVLRDLAVHHDNIRGVNMLRDGDLTVEHVRFEGVSTNSPVIGNGVTAHYGAGTSGMRAHVIVRDSHFEVGGIGISLGGDVDAIVERNHIRNSVSRLLCISVSPVGQGGTMLTTPGTETNVEIRDNLFEDCGKATGNSFNSITIFGAPGATTTGTVNVVGNTLRNIDPNGCTAAGILYEFYTGVIERNIVSGVTQSCSPATATRNGRAGIFIGSRVANIRPANVAVRFNDILDNEYAGLRIGPNQPTPIDARCNWWGSATAPVPSSTESRNGVVVEGDPTGRAPLVAPSAGQPVAASLDVAQSCSP